MKRRILQCLPRSPTAVAGLRSRSLRASESHRIQCTVWNGEKGGHRIASHRIASQSQPLARSSGGKLPKQASMARLPVTEMGTFLPNAAGGGVTPSCCRCRPPPRFSPTGSQFLRRAASPDQRGPQGCWFGHPVMDGLNPKSFTTTSPPPCTAAACSVGRWPVLVCSERRVLLAGCWLLVAGLF
jgi:hypothetical protein